MKPDNYINIKEASLWASEYLKKEITPSSISYLINYGRIENKGNNGNVIIDIDQLKTYYESYYGSREINWKDKLGSDIDWHLSFDNYREAETTKHVHRLHPYKGKFIPQLVEYFLDDNIDEFKKEVFFNEGDIVLDPFCGSGTTLVQANELGMHAIGIDISKFNSLISNIKVRKHNLIELNRTIQYITSELLEFVHTRKIYQFEEELLNELNIFNTKYFPSPEYKRKVRTKEINEFEYGKKHEEIFHEVFNKLVTKYSIKVVQDNNGNSFIDNWYLHPVREEIDFIFDKIKSVNDNDLKSLLTVILSRVIRSCRATTHSDLATLLEPVSSTYYCSKHGKICKPLFSILSWWKRYTNDTIKRLSNFDRLRSNTFQICFSGDSRNIDLKSKLSGYSSNFSEIYNEKKIKGIFTSPPYVGLINYHEQHAYAYDLFGFERNDDLEIGPLFKGKGKEARNSYIEGISQVLINSMKYLADDFNIFIVANDKHNMYPEIAKRANLKIVQQFKRPVLNRTEKDKNAYSESIFRMKKID
ncbi:MAG: site-specific DNA-methyltransferase [Ignavibacteriae bacterium]|nr:site-specific DNA-methyltransferase [Ignavibacteriota bacterium]NOG98156.1 site-specific DNA-methyltransferase [Ignavibacteriota bacterium]